MTEPGELNKIEIIKKESDYLRGRADRKRARLKYLIADWGLERFRAKVQEYYGRPFSEPRPVHVSAVDNHLGWPVSPCRPARWRSPKANGRCRVIHGASRRTLRIPEQH
jgi:hypothetical protein